MGRYEGRFRNHLRVKVFLVSTVVIPRTNLSPTLNLNIEQRQQKKKIKKKKEKDYIFKFMYREEAYYNISIITSQKYKEREEAIYVSLNGPADLFSVVTVGFSKVI